MARVEDMLHKMMRRFDANEENIKELRGDIAIIAQKVDTNAISIKLIELQVAQLSATVNTRQQGTLPSNTCQNLKNDAHCMAITTQGGKQTNNPTMPSTQENVRKNNDNVVKGSGQAEKSNGKDAEVPIKVISMPTPPSPFPQRLVKKSEDNKYLHFYNNVEEAFYQCRFGRIFTSNARLCQIYERSGYKEKISHFRG